MNLHPDLPAARMCRCALLLALLGLCIPLRGAPVEPIKNRKNVAGAIYGATAELTCPDGKVKDASSLLSGSHKDNAAVSFAGVPGVLTIRFAQPEQINLIRIYPGVLAYAMYPSGEAGICDYTIERYNNGYYHPLVTAKDMPVFAKSGAANGDEFCYEHKFIPVKAESLRITVTRSGHSGRTASSPAPVPVEKRASHIRAVEVYSARRSDDLAVWLRDAVRGDFTLSVYQDQTKATLQLEGLQFNELPAVLSVTEEKSGRPVLKRPLVLKKGMQSIGISLSDIPAGRYIAMLKAADPKSVFKGEVRRMLRVDRLPVVRPPAEPVQVRGCRIFPVDEHHFVNRSNVQLTVPEARSQEVSRPMLPGTGRQDGRGSQFLSRDSQGNFVFRFVEYDENRRAHTFYCSSRDLKNWSAPAEKTPTGEPTKAIVSPFASNPAAARPNWHVKTRFADAVIRPYDAAKDGKFALSEVRVQWFPPSIGDLKAKGIRPWTTYPLIERNGQWLLLTKEPLYVERFDYNGDSLETEIDCNDNFGNQYLTQDGRTLCVGKGGKLRVFPPFTVEYDNLPETQRIMRIYQTQDGIHWSYHYFAPPRESDPRGWQHYGYAVHYVDRDFYVGFLSAYDCVKQQIYPELCYSRDGLVWHRLPNAEKMPFIRNTPGPHSWLYGMIFVESAPAPFAWNGRYYLPLGACWARPHFFPTPKAGKTVTGTEMQRSFESRRLAEEWPYFKTDMQGSWDRLGKAVTAAVKNTVGFAEFRKDGFFAISPASEDRDANLLSRVFSCPGGTLKLNAQGTIQVLLVDDKTGKVIPGYECRFAGDDTGTKPLVWQNGKTALPDSPFRVQLSFEKGTTLYTLQF